VWRVRDVLTVNRDTVVTAESRGADVAMEQNNIMTTNLLTVAEIAAQMRVSKMTVYRLVQSGALTGIRFGRSYRVSETSVQQYLESVNSGH
jgi:excisionase family DNA binding protein